MKNALPLSILSGILLGTSYIPFPPWAIFFGYVPMWMAFLAAPTYRQIWWSGWRAQFVGTLIGFHWVAFTVHEFGHLPWAFGIFCLIAFSALANLHMPLSGLAWKWCSQKLNIPLGRSLFLLPAFMCLGEWLSPMIFDWNFGYTWLYGQFPAMNFADVIGANGLSHVTIFVNLFFLFVILNAWTLPKKLAACGLSVLIFGVVNLLGYYWGQRIPAEDSTLSVGIVQANIGNLEKQYAEHGDQFRSHILQEHFELARTLKGVDLMVWPETAFPDTLKVGHWQNNNGHQLTLLSQELGVTIATGGYGIEPDGRPSNSFFVIANGDVVKPSYPKTILLAFGEYFPFGETLPFLKTWFPEVGDFARGPGPTVIVAPVKDKAIKLGAQICYEGLFDRFSVGLAKKGAQILVNLTNDSWFGERTEPFQHLYMTLSRAIETRRPLIRSTNTGISTVITARGKILELSPIHQKWAHRFEVPFFSEPMVTAFTSVGYILEPLVLVLFIMCILFISYRERKP